MEHITTNICKTSNIGVNDNLFGGTMLSWLDEAGAIFACKLCKVQRMVTVKMNSVEFKNPVKVGTHVYIKGEPIAIGQKSITLRVAAIDYTSKMKILCTTDIIFVNINKEGQSIRIDPHIILQIKKLINA